LYVEDFKRGTNKDIDPKDIFEMGSKLFYGREHFKSQISGNTGIIKLEVVPKPQIRFKRTRARHRPIEKVVVLSIHDGLVCEHLSDACNVAFGP
jgi:hypothetical protein